MAYLKDLGRVLISLRGQQLRGLALPKGTRHHVQKKSLHAAEQDRPDVARRRARWKKYQGRLAPGRLVFIDETWVKTNMTRRHGRAQRGQRPSWPPCASIGSTRPWCSMGRSTAAPSRLTSSNSWSIVGNWSARMTWKLVILVGAIFTAGGNWSARMTWKLVILHDEALAYCACAKPTGPRSTNGWVGSRTSLRAHSARMFSGFPQ